MTEDSSPQSAPQPDPDPRLSLLLDGIIRLAAGDLHSRIEPSPARDEIDAVITGTNLLAEDLQLVYQELEERVESRTAMLREAHLEMEKMALTDALTGLANRAALIRAVENALAAASRGEPPPALLLLDLDSFKSVNDSLGHGAGDKVLMAVADRVKAAVRQTDTVARLGGDEFAVLLPAATLTAARNAGKRILESLEASVEVENRSVICRASIGIRLADPEQSAEDLLQEADIAMYIAKSEGRSTIKVFEPVMLYARQMRNLMAVELREAIEGNQLVLFYQPVVELATGRIEGVEALVRWNHPSRGMVMPDEFIPIAEEIGAIADLGRWVLTAAVTQLRSWQTGLGLADFSMRVNVSPSELQRIDLVEDVREALQESGVHPASLVLELTESAFVTGNDLDRYSITSLKRLGVGLEIDDFGTGYSSISYLRRLPVDKVKIDRSLLGDVVRDQGQRAFVAAILQLVRACELEPVVEGIETSEQAELLRRLGCPSGQGYFFGRPLPAEDFAEVLRRSVAVREPDSVTPRLSVDTAHGPSAGGAPVPYVEVD